MIFYSSSTVFPAPAGMNRIAACDDVGLLRVPRARGDEPVVNVTATSQVKCSPRPRG